MVGHVNHVSLTGEPMDFQAVCVDTLKSGGLAKTLPGSRQCWSLTVPRASSEPITVAGMQKQWHMTMNCKWICNSGKSSISILCGPWDLLHGIEKCLQILSNCSGENLQSVSKCWTKHSYCEGFGIVGPGCCWNDWGIESIFAQAAAHCWWTWCGSCDHESGIIRHLYNSHTCICRNGRWPSSSSLAE